MLQGYGTSLLTGAGLSIAVALASLVIASVLGVAGAMAKLSRNRALRGAAQVYTTVVRGVPDLVMMFLVFYGGQLLLNKLADRFHWEDVTIAPFVAGTLTIGFIFGAYLTETFRGAILAIPHGQAEAGRAFGMTPLQVFRRIVLPQMVRLALPGFANNWLVLVKSTALVSVIGLTDMMQKAGQAAGATRQPFVFYAAVGVLYLAITSASELGFGWLDRRTSRSDRRAHD